MADEINNETDRGLVINKNETHSLIVKLQAAGCAKIIRIIPISSRSQYLIFHQSKSIDNHNKNRTAHLS